MKRKMRVVVEMVVDDEESSDERCRLATEIGREDLPRLADCEGPIELVDFMDRSADDEPREWIVSGSGLIVSVESSRVVEASWVD